MRFTNPKDDAAGVDRILVLASDGRIVIAGGDGETSAMTELHATIDDEGQLAVPSSLLLNAVESVEGARVEVHTSSNGARRKTDRVHTFRLGGGGSSFSFEFHDVKQPLLFPAEEISAPDLEGERLRPVDGGFRELLAGTIYASSNDTERPHLCGVHLDVNRRVMTGIATDGHRLAAVEIQASATSVGAGIFAATMPKRAVKLVLATKGEITHVGLVRADRLALRVGHLLVITKPVDSQFPPWQQVVPASDENRVAVSRAELLAACNSAVRVRTSANPVCMLITGDRVRLVVKEEEPTLLAVFDVDARLVAHSHRLPWPSALRPEFFASALEALVGDRVEIVFTPDVDPKDGAQLGPILIRDGAGRRAVIMPVRHDALPEIAAAAESLS